jgi:hypothetical protein
LVSCKDVGFMVYRLKSFICKSFSVFFHLWGMEVLTGVETLISGAWRKMLNGP